MDYTQIPKVELHRHLELSLRHDTIRELAPRAGIDLSTPDRFAQGYLITEPMQDLTSVLHKFLVVQPLFETEAIIERIAYEACEDAYADGIRLLELRYAPTFITQSYEHMNFDRAHEAILRGIHRAQQDFSMGVGLIGIIQRTLAVADARAVAEFVIANSDTFIGLDMADDDSSPIDVKVFAPLFERAKAAGLGITVHAGESNTPEAPKFVKSVIDYLGADRIGHGVQMHQYPEMIDYLVEKDVPLELCVTSNWLTQAIETLPAYPFRLFMEAGVKTTINSDDPSIFNISLSSEYELLHRIHGFNDAEFRHCNRIAARASFLPEEIKQRYWQDL